MFKRIAVALLCAMFCSVVSADENQAAAKKAAAAKKQAEAAARAKAAAVQAAASRSYYLNMYTVRKEVDPLDTVERFALFAPGGPIVVEVSMTIDTKPFRVPREQLIETMLDSIEKDDDGKRTWLTALKSPHFTMGRYGNLTDERLQGIIKNFDANKDGAVDRYEARLYVSRSFQGPSFVVNSRKSYGGYGAGLVVLQNGRVTGGGGAADVYKLLDVDGDGALSKEEIDGASERLKSRDADDNDLLYAAEISGPSPRATYRGGARQVVQTAVVLGPLANADTLFSSMTAHYKNDKGEITAKSFSAKPELFKQLDQNENGVIEKDEVLALNDAAPDVSLKLDVGNEKEGKGLSVVSTPKGVDVEKSPTSVKIKLPGLGLAFSASTAKARVFDYSRNATSYITRFDKDKNGYLEKKELMANLVRQFDVWDADKDGKVYAKEITASYARARAPMKTQIRASAAKQGNQLFDKLDLSGDKRLSLREMRNAHVGLREYDANKDGKITADEIPTSLTVSFAPAGGYTYSRPTVLRRNGQGGRPAAATPKSDAPEWFTRMDRNRDGDVTSKEFLAGKIKKLDTNGDGFIEPKEAKSAKFGESKPEGAKKEAKKPEEKK